MPENRRSLLTSLLVAVAADLTVATIIGLTTPTRWILARLDGATGAIGALALLPAGGVLAVIGFLALMGLNGWLFAHRYVDDEAPGVGRLVIFLVLGLPTALIQILIVAIAYLALT